MLVSSVSPQLTRGDFVLDEELLYFDEEGSFSYINTGDVGFGYDSDIDLDREADIIDTLKRLIPLDISVLDFPSLKVNKDIIGYIEKGLKMPLSTDAMIVLRTYQAALILYRGDYKASLSIFRQIKDSIINNMYFADIYNHIEYLSAVASFLDGDYEESLNSLFASGMLDNLNDKIRETAVVVLAANNMYDKALTFLNTNVIKRLANSDSYIRMLIDVLIKGKNYKRLNELINYFAARMNNDIIDYIVLSLIKDGKYDTLHLLMNKCKNYKPINIRAKVALISLGYFLHTSQDDIKNIIKLYTSGGYKKSYYTIALMKIFTKWPFANIERAVVSLSKYIPEEAFYFALKRFTLLRRYKSVYDMFKDRGYTSASIDLFYMGIASFMVGDFEVSMLSLRALLSKSDMIISPIVYYTLALLYAKNGDYNVAYKYIKLFLLQTKSSIPYHSYIKLLYLAYFNMEFDMLLKFYKTGNKGFYILAAISSLYVGNYEVAINLFDKVMGLFDKGSGYILREIIDISKKISVRTVLDDVIRRLKCQIKEA